MYMHKRSNYKAKHIKLSSAHKTSKIPRYFICMSRKARNTDHISQNAQYIHAQAYDICIQALSMHTYSYYVHKTMIQTYI